jgi:hypothetical protein
MKFITKLDVKQSRQLVDNKKLCDVVIFPMHNNFKEILETFLESNTGFSSKLVVGLTKIMGEVSLENSWEDISSMISVKSGQFLLEFDVESDLVASLPYDKFLSLMRDKSIDETTVFDNIVIDKELKNEDSVISFVPFLKFEDCTGFKLIGDNWEKNDSKVSSPSMLSELFIFGGMSNER